MRFLRVLAEEALAPGELANPVIVSGNHGEDDIQAPKQETVALWITGPLGEVVEISAPPGLQDVPVEGERSIKLELGERVRPPGQYKLLAAWGSGRAAETSWFQEGAGSWRVALPVRRGPAQVSECYALFRGERLEAIYQISVRWDEDNDPDRITVLSPLRLCRTGGAAHSLSVVSGVANTKWVFWLEGGRLFAGMEYFGWQQMSCELPFQPGRILPTPMVTPEGDCLVLVASADQDEIALVRFEKLSEEAAMDRAVAEDDEEFPPLSDGLLVWRYRTRKAFAGCAAALGKHGMGGLALTFHEGEDSALEYAKFDSDQPPGNFVSLAVAGSPWTGIDPAIGLDHKGRAHVVILVKGAIARASFNEEGASRLDKGTEYYAEEKLEGPLASGVAELLMSDGDDPWMFSWAAGYSDGRCVANGHFVHGAVAKPIALLTLPQKTFIAAEDPFRVAFLPVLQVE